MKTTEAVKRGILLSIGPLASAKRCLFTPERPRDPDLHSRRHRRPALNTIEIIGADRLCIRDWC